MTNFTDQDYERARKMAEVTSLAALMKSNARLKKHAAVAQKAVPNQDYAGPEGEVVTKFSKKNIITKDSKVYVVFDFLVDGTVSGQEKYASHRIGILHGLVDSEYATMEQELERMYCNIQKMGVKTADRPTEDIDKEIDSLRGQSFKIRCTKSKKNGKMYFDIIGHVDDEQDYSGGEVETADEDVPVDEPEVEADGDDEWQEELAEDEEPESEVDAAEYNPSDWVGYDVQYKPAKSPKPLTFKVVDADDDAGTVVLERDGKQIKKVKFTDLILP